MKAHFLIYLGLSFIFPNRALAEGGCPAGMIPANGTNINSCVPIPQGYYRQSEALRVDASPVWVNQWLAIASDSTNGAVGTAIDVQDKIAAEDQALRKCKGKGGIKCKVDVSFRNGCAALVAGDEGYNVQGAATLERATSHAMEICTKSTTNCYVYYSACSLPRRIQ